MRLIGIKVIITFVIISVIEDLWSSILYFFGKRYLQKITIGNLLEYEISDIELTGILLLLSIIIVLILTFIPIKINKKRVHKKDR
jgi:membrane-anchored glycerophosphoryl diester phosphodiesterase (GDPDase)